MKFTLVGVENVDYTNRQGKRVIGKRLHVLQDSVGEKIRGSRVREMWISSEKEIYKTVDNLPLNKQIEVYFDMYNNPDYVAPIK